MEVIIIFHPCNIFNRFEFDRNLLKRCYQMSYFKAHQILFQLGGLRAVPQTSSELEGFQAAYF